MTEWQQLINCCSRTQHSKWFAFSICTMQLCLNANPLELRPSAANKRTHIRKIYSSGIRSTPMRRGVSLSPFVLFCPVIRTHPSASEFSSFASSPSPTADDAREVYTCGGESNDVQSRIFRGGGVHWWKYNQNIWGRLTTHNMKLYITY